MKKIGGEARSDTGPEGSCGSQSQRRRAHINNNIRTLKRVRRTHDKFLALNLNSEDGSGPNLPPELPEPVDADDDIDVQVDERPWRTRGTGLEVGEQDANDCLHWMGSKVLEHVGFQGSFTTLLSGVTRTGLTWVW